jgi:hypothetical protein
MPSHGSTSTRVHTRRPPSSRVPASPPASAPVAVLSCCTAAIPVGSPSGAPDKALTSANPAHQVTGASSGVHAVKEATEAGLTPLPRNLTPSQPGAGHPDSPTTSARAYRGLHSNFRFCRIARIADSHSHPVVRISRPHRKVSRSSSSYVVRARRTPNICLRWQYGTFACRLTDHPIMARASR